MAEHDLSPKVRLYLASTLQRLPPNSRWTILGQLVRHGEDADDPNIPLMLWYAMEPLVDNDAERFIQLAVDSKLSLIHEHIARRIASHPSAEIVSIGLQRLVAFLPEASASTQEAILNGLLAGVEGRRMVKTPSNWSTTFSRLVENPENAIHRRAVELGVVFKDPQAVNAAITTIENEAATLKSRLDYLSIVLAEPMIDSDAMLFRLLGSDAMRIASVRG